MGILFIVFLALSLFAPGYALITVFALPRHFPLGVLETFLAGIILSLSILITPPIIFDWTLQIPLLKWSIYCYATLVVISSVFLLIRLVFNWRQAAAEVRRLITNQAWLILVAVGTGLVWIALLAKSPVVADWDGWQFYLRDGILYSRILHLPAFVPEPYAQPNLVYIYTPPMQPVLYAYGLSVEKWLAVPNDYKLLSVYNLILLMAIGGTLYLFVQRSALPKGVSLLALLIWATYPLTLEVLQTAFLSVDIPYACFSLAAIYFAIRTFESPQGGGFFGVLASLACGLSFAVKIQGPLTVMLIGLIGAYYVLPRFLRWALAFFLTVGLVFVFFSMMPALFRLVMSWHFALSIGLMGLVFALFYGGTGSYTERKNWKTLAGMGAVFVLLVSANAMLLYRGYAITGSIGGWYTAGSVKEFTPNFEWAKSIDIEKMAFQVWRGGGGARPGLPQLRDLTPFIGYEWNPTLLIFAIFGAATLLSDKRLGTIRLIVALLPVTVLIWWLATGMDLTRQLLIVSPSFALLQAVGIERVLGWVSKHVGMGVRCAYVALLLLFGAPFWMPFLNTYIKVFSPPFSLTPWNGSGNWSYYTAENLKQVVKYMFAVDAVMLSVLPFRREVNKLLTGLSRRPRLAIALVVSLLVALWGIMGLPAVNIMRDYGVSGFQSAYANVMYGGFIPALRAAEALSETQHGIVMTYRDFALPALTGYRRIVWNLADPVRNGYYKDLLTARNMTEALGMLQRERVVAAILPADERNYRYNLYVRTKHQQTDLPLLWLVDDSGVFSSTRVGDWKVIDIDTGPERFAGFVTVLLETDSGRGRIYRKAEGFRAPSSTLSLVPVVDISGLLPPDKSSSDGYRWAVETTARFRVLRYNGSQWNMGESLTKTVRTNDIFAMPSFDLTEMIASLGSRSAGFRYYGLQVTGITCRVYDAQGQLVSEFHLDSRPRTETVLGGYIDTRTGLWVSYPQFNVPGTLPPGTNFVYDPVTGNWQMPPDTNPLFSSEESERCPGALCS